MRTEIQFNKPFRQTGVNVIKFFSFVTKEYAKVMFVPGEPI
jgi:hypothetical protein